MPPAAAAAGGAAAGMLPGIIAAANQTGKTHQQQQSFPQSKNYDPNSFKYGGNPTAAGEARSTFGNNQGYYIGQSGDQLQRANAAGEQGQQARGLALQARGGANTAANLTLNRAQGRNLVSTQIANQNRKDLTARMGSAAASAQGPAALANAQTDRMAAEAQGLGNISGNEMTSGMQEQAEAEKAAGGAFNNLQAGDAAMRSGDLTQQGQNLGAAGTMGGLAVNYGNLGNRVNEDVQQGGQYQQNLVAGSEAGAMQQHEGQEARNNSLDLQYLGMGAGGAAGGAQVGMNAATANAPPPPPAGKAHGGDVAGRRPYLVGEQGPELIIPKEDGFVLTAPQTRAILEDGMKREEGGKVMGGGREDYRRELDQASVVNPRNMPKSFHRDTPAEQNEVRSKHYQDLMRQADELMAAMNRMKAQGPSVARDEGEIEDAAPGEPAQWLTDYMGSQQRPSLAIARAAGGPITKSPGASVDIGGKGFASQGDILAAGTGLTGDPTAPVGGGGLVGGSPYQLPGMATDSAGGGGGGPVPREEGSVVKAGGEPAQWHATAAEGLAAGVPAAYPVAAGVGVGQMLRSHDQAQAKGEPSWWDKTKDFANRAGNAIREYEPVTHVLNPAEGAIGPVYGAGQALGKALKWDSDQGEAEDQSAAQTAQARERNEPSADESPRELEVQETTTADRKALPSKTVIAPPKVAQGPMRKRQESGHTLQSLHDRLQKLEAMAASMRHQ